MKIQNCSNCNIKPDIQSDELGITYRLICRGCGKHTGDIMSPSSSLDKPHCDESTLNLLIQEWNGKN